nr:RNA-directed DNA polymerase, eukaryota, reverse transcriptase zinc-binding domain protein [Tanacetum cinerariifolium]
MKIDVVFFLFTLPVKDELFLTHIACSFTGHKKNDKVVQDHIEEIRVVKYGLNNGDGEIELKQIKECWAIWINVRMKTPEEEQMEKIRVEEQNKKKKFADNEAGMQDRRKNFSSMKKHNENIDPVKEKTEGSNNENRKQWLLKNKEFEAMKRTANKFLILGTLPDDDPVEIRRLKDRIIVIQFINKKIQPSVQEIKNWFQDMVKYFIEKWKDGDDYVEEDILEEVSELERNVTANEIDGRVERKLLWKELYMHKRISGVHPWDMQSDMNVTLNIEEHSSGGSYVTEKMQDFKGNLENSILKKLDRVMVSKVFHEEFAVKRMKYIKQILNKLNWRNGDLTIRVEKLRVILNEAQALVEKNPHKKSIKTKSIEALDEYNKAVKDEEKLLAQKARIDWLNDTDKNIAFVPSYSYTSTFPFP